MADERLSDVELAKIASTDYLWQAAPSHVAMDLARELQEARAAIREVVTALDKDTGGGPYQDSEISTQWAADKMRALLPEEG